MAQSTVVLNKASVGKLTKYMRILAQVGASPTENLEDDAFKSDVEKRIAMITGPIMASAYAAVADDLNNLATLRRDQLEKMILEKMKKSEMDFINNPNNEALLIEISKISRAQSPEWERSIREGEAKILPRHPNLTICQMAGFALIGEVVGVHKVMMPNIYEVFDEIAAEQAQQQTPSVSGGGTIHKPGRFKKRK
ncbi:MAG: hypothetical protein LW823_03980 [Rickettsiales bacterium]|jgi:hypothetical protein|nr:hypothetical protein [Rickettsiales bacterium]